MLVERVPSGTRTVVLVEGDSDREAVVALARRSGVDLQQRAVAVVAMGGVTNVGHHVRRFVPGPGRAGTGVRLLGLCDRGESAHFARAFAAAGLPSVAVSSDDVTAASGFCVCDRDLEDELIRAIGVDAVLAFAAGRGDLGAFERLQRQPAQRGRSVEQQLHRFLGTRAGRKRQYAIGLAELVPLDAVPAPLAALVAQLAT